MMLELNAAKGGAKQGKHTWIDFISFKGKESTYFSTANLNNVAEFMIRSEKPPGTS